MTARSTAWKALEKHAATVLGGKRLQRGSDFGVSAPDILVTDKVSDSLGKLTTLIVECKYSKDQPWVRMVYDLLKDVHPSRTPLIVHDKMYLWILEDTYDVIEVLFGGPTHDTEISNLSWWIEKYHILYITKKVPKYIVAGLAQAELYSGWVKNELFIPILCLGHKGKHSRLCIAWKEHLEHGIQITQ